MALRLTGDFQRFLLGQPAPLRRRLRRPHRTRPPHRRDRSPGRAPPRRPNQAELIEQAEIADVAGLALLSGARARLAALPPDRYTIVTSGGRHLATTRLLAVGLPIPPTMLTASDITRGKPDPQLGFDPRTCLVFEDAPSGIRAAQAAGATVIALPTAYPQDELSAADAIIPSLAAVSATMDQAHTRRSGPKSPMLEGCVLGEAWGSAYSDNSQPTTDNCSLPS
jgi:HAD superfamily hydrolase (TIGR01509 family)